MKKHLPGPIVFERVCIHHHFLVYVMEPFAMQNWTATKPLIYWIVLIIYIYMHAHIHIYIYVYIIVCNMFPMVGG